MADAMRGFLCDTIFPMTKDTYSIFETIRSMAKFVGPYKGRFWFATFMRGIAEIVWLYPAYAMASITTFFVGYQPGESLATFWKIMALYAAASIFYYGAKYLANHAAFPMAEKVAMDAKLATMKHVFSLDIDWHEKENTGNRVKRIDRGGEAFNQLIRMYFAAFIEIAVGLVGVLFVISRLDLVIAGLMAAFLAAYFFVSVFYKNKAMAAKRAENLRDEEFSGLVFESVNNIRSAKVMSMIDPISGMLRKLAGELIALINRRIFWFQSGNGVKGVLGQIFRVGILCYIGWGIMHGKYEVGFLILFYGYFSTVQGAIMQLADVSQEVAIKKQDIGRMTDLLKVAPVTDVEVGKVSFPKDWKKIELRNVSFSYGEGESKKQVLNDVSFTVMRGEKIGLVGLSGAGKSTIFKLLLKERENYEGEIYVDDVPLRTISKRDYFTRTAIVLQDTEVFNFSLRDNVTISNHERAANDGLLDKALTVAHVSEFARALPQGIDTRIGEKGVKLSGGEKQRVGLARAVFKDPQLLLLDEATSHLDVESEEKIQDSLHQFFQSVTAIVIAHRLSTIKEMDKIIVLEGGKIIEQGNFADLLKLKGRFAELWDKLKI